MTKYFISSITFVAALMAGSMVSAAQFVVELSESLNADSAISMESAGVSEVERFDAEGKSYIVLDAKDEAALDTFFDANGVDPLKITEVGFVNSPEVGGGDKAGSDPLPGYQSYVIERPVPGIGKLPMETQKQLSAGSNAALSQIGDGIEWVHSYLTDDGTYCVYRAVDTDKIVEHGRISEFPIDTILEVVHTKVE